MTRYFFLVVVMSTRMKPAPLHAALDLFQLREVQLVAEDVLLLPGSADRVDGVLAVLLEGLLRDVLLDDDAVHHLPVLEAADDLLDLLLRPGEGHGGRESEADLAEGEDLRLRLPHVRPVLGDEVLELALELGDPVLVGLALLLCGLLGPEDLLVHLAQEQLEKKASQVIEGEKLDLLIGNRPIEKADDLKKEEKDAVKQNVLNILKEMYGIDEEDFYSAELEIVPAGKARDCGLDRSMNLSYGQDDRVCAFTSLFAMLDVTEAKKTGCCLLVDKEEIGSVGATGMHSRFFENTVAELIAVTEGESELKVRRALSNSKMLSSDVSAAFDPMFAEAFEKRSSAFFANGITFNKFTGSRGKSGSNDANGEYIAALRRTMDEAQVAYQFAELGRVDLGGGGTIAYIMANYGMEVIDSGVAVLNMHAPYEVSSKADVYEAVKGYRAFLRME